jgi:predicted nucleic acid-binding Zn ribbon protein
MTDHSKDLILHTCGPSFSVVAFDLFSIDASISEWIASVIEPEPGQYLSGQGSSGQNLTIKPCQQSLANKTLPGQNLIYSLPQTQGVIGDLMTEIPLHRHCLICGNAVRPDENFCDELCESKFKSAQRKQQLLFVAFIVIMGLVLFLPSILKMKG